MFSIVFRLDSGAGAAKQAKGMEKNEGGPTLDLAKGQGCLVHVEPRLLSLGDL